MRVSAAIARNKRRCENAVGLEILAEVEDSLCQIGGSLLASLGITVAGPGQLGESSCTRPHLDADDRVINLLGPQGSGNAEDVLLLCLGHVGVKVVVVDALPGLVGGAPRATGTAVVEGKLRAGRVWVYLGRVVAGVVGDVAAVAAVEVEEGPAGNDNVVSHISKATDVVGVIIPGLHNNILGNVGGSRVVG